MHPQGSHRPAPPNAAAAHSDPVSGVESEVVDFLARRFSVGPKFLAQPAPTEAQWRQAATLASRAPDHCALRPFRFVIVGDEQRTALAALFADDAARRGRDDAEVGRARERAFNGPALVALVTHIRADVPDVPEHEQWLCAGAALMNLLNALHLMGFGAKTLSGASVRAPAIRAAFCDEGEELVAWVIAGTAMRSAAPKHAPDGHAVIGRWDARPVRGST